jgi:hypothetical protein
MGYLLCQCFAAAVTVHPYTVPGSTLSTFKYPHACHEYGDACKAEVSGASYMLCVFPANHVGPAGKVCVEAWSEMMAALQGVRYLVSS